MENARLPASANGGGDAGVRQPSRPRNQFWNTIGAGCAGKPGRRSDLACPKELRAPSLPPPDLAPQRPVPGPQSGSAGACGSSSIEAAGGILLLVSTVVALAWANSPWSAAYRDLWATEIAFDIGGHVVAEDLHHWVNDGLMALFFFVVGLEIKQELVTRSPLEVRGRPCCPLSPPSGAWWSRRSSTPPSTSAATAAPVGASPWRPTSPSRSGCSPCSATVCRRR